MRSHTRYTANRYSTRLGNRCTVVGNSYKPKLSHRSDGLFLRDDETFVQFTAPRPTHIVQTERRSSQQLLLQ